jgi:hypothetical protein
MQFVLYLSFIIPNTKSANGPKKALALLTAKNKPSFPVGARSAVQLSCLGDHNTSPNVMTTCHKHAPTTFGEIATKMGDTAISQRPGIMIWKTSRSAVNEARNGGNIKHIIRLILWMVYIGTDSPNLG